MDNSSFDAAGSVDFDLPAGAIRYHAAAPCVLLPRAALEAFGGHPALEEAARELGQSCGVRLVASLGGGLGDAGVEVLADHLAGCLATLGFGRAAIELRGDALLLRRHPAVPGGASLAERLFVGAFSAAYVGVLAGEELAVTFVSLHGDEELWFLGHPDTAALLGQELGAGHAPDEALRRLHQGARS